MTEPDQPTGPSSPAVGVRPQDLADAALAAATLPGVVLVADRTEANLRWALSSLTTNGQMHALTVTVVATAPVEGGTAVATVSREVADRAAVPGLVAAAEQAARSGPPVDDAVELVADYPHGDDWDAGPEPTSIDVLATVAEQLGEAFRADQEADRQLFGFAELVVTTTYLASSTGLRRRTVQRTGRLELNAKDAAGGSAWAGVATQDFSDVDVTALHAELVRRLGWSATRVELPAGRYETLLPPSAVADLMVYLYWTASARDAEEGRNVFAAGDGRTRIGERLSPLPISLLSDPAAPGLECAPFVIAEASDGATTSVLDNGLPLAATSWLTDGRLTELARDRGWAARSGQQARPPIDNLVLDGRGSATLDEMVARTERGLLLTCLWYIREVDPETLLLTGLTRDGVYLVEHGQVVGQVNNFRFNESPVDLLRRTTEVGVGAQTLPREWSDYFTRAVMPPLRIPDFNMSTVSQAS